MKSQQNVESPCVNKCCLNEHDICLGCFRHLEEIKLWGLADNDVKEKILKAAKKRKIDRIRSS